MVWKRPEPASTFFVVSTVVGGGSKTEAWASVQAEVNVRPAYAASISIVGPVGFRCRWTLAEDDVTVNEAHCVTLDAGMPCSIDAQCVVCTALQGDPGKRRANTHAISPE